MTSAASVPPHLTFTSGSGQSIDYLALNDGRDALIVLMSNALVVGREDRRFPAFHRWSWAKEWPNCTVLAIADPGLRRRPILDGAWYLDAEHDTIRGVAELAQAEAEKRGIPAQNLLFYGSSLGGFGALAAASAARGRALAEVPQIDVTKWFPGAIEKIETWVLRQPIADFRTSFGEQVDVWDRFLFEKHIPPFTILTNETDRSFSDQLELLGLVREHSLYRETQADLVISARTEGHRVQSKEIIVRMVAEEVARF